MCNPGASAALLGIEEQMKQLFAGVTLKDISDMLGREIGVVRISLGLASNFQDVWRVVQFASMMGQDHMRKLLYDQWVESQSCTVTI
jgi:molybdenum cofactor sulfurtransferase